MNEQQKPELLSQSIAELEDRERRSQIPCKANF